MKKTYKRNTYVEWRKSLIETSLCIAVDVPLIVNINQNNDTKEYTNKKAAFKAFKTHFYRTRKDGTWSLSMVESKELFDNDNFIKITRNS